MLKRMHKGNLGDECYSVLWKAPNGNHMITGVRDNERNTVYRIYGDDIIRFVDELNRKEHIRHSSYKSITDAFEKTIRQAEDKYLELYDKLKILEVEKKALREKHIKGLEKENEQLKQELNRYKYLLNQREKELEEYKQFMGLGD